MNRKEGLDYYYCDVGFYRSDIIKILRAKFGILSEIVVNRLLSKIFESGYYIKWDQEIQLVFAMEIGFQVSDELVGNVVRELFNKGFLNGNLYSEYGVLTGEYVQRVFFDAVHRRKEVKYFTELMLIDIKEKNNVLAEKVGFNGRVMAFQVENENDEIDECVDDIEDAVNHDIEDECGKNINLVEENSLKDLYIENNEFGGNDFDIENSSVYEDDCFGLKKNESDFHIENSNGVDNDFGDMSVKGSNLAELVECDNDFDIENSNVLVDDCIGLNENESDFNFENSNGFDNDFGDMSIKGSNLAECDNDFHIENSSALEDDCLGLKKNESDFHIENSNGFDNDLGNKSVKGSKLAELVELAECDNDFGNVSVKGSNLAEMVECDEDFHIENSSDLEDDYSGLKKNESDFHIENSNIVDNDFGNVSVKGSNLAEMVECDEDFHIENSSDLEDDYSGLKKNESDCHIENNNSVDNDFGNVSVKGSNLVEMVELVECDNDFDIENSSALEDDYSGLKKNESDCHIENSNIVDNDFGNVIVKGSNLAELVECDNDFDIENSIALEDDCSGLKKNESDNNFHIEKNSSLNNNLEKIFAKGETCQENIGSEYCFDKENNLSIYNAKNYSKEAETADSKDILDKIENVYILKQSKVKKNKLNKNKLNNNNNNNGQKNIAIDYYEKYFVKAHSDLDKIQYWVNYFNGEIVLEAMKRGVDNGIFDFKYCNSILRKWKVAMVKTGEDIEKLDLIHYNLAGGKSSLFKKEMETGRLNNIGDNCGNFEIKNRESTGKYSNVKWKTVYKDPRIFNHEERKYDWEKLEEMERKLNFAQFE